VLVLSNQRIEPTLIDVCEVELFEVYCYSSTTLQGDGKTSDDRRILFEVNNGANHAGKVGLRAKAIVIGLGVEDVCD